MESERRIEPQNNRDRQQLSEGGPGAFQYGCQRTSGVGRNSFRGPRFWQTHPELPFFGTSPGALEGRVVELQARFSF